MLQCEWCINVIGIVSIRAMGQRLHEDDSQVRLKVVFAGYDSFAAVILSQTHVVCEI